MSEENDKPSAAQVADLIAEEFGGVDTPVSAEHLAALYGVIAAQSDAMLAVYRLAMKANPELVFSEARIAAERSMANQAEALTAALIRLARTYGKTEGKE